MIPKLSRHNSSVVAGPYKRLDCAICLKGLGTKSVQRGIPWVHYSTERVNLSMQSASFESTLPALAKSWASEILLCGDQQYQAMEESIWHLYHLATENNSNSRQSHQNSSLLRNRNQIHLLFVMNKLFEYFRQYRGNGNAWISDITWERVILIFLLNIAYRNLGWF